MKFIYVIIILIIIALFTGTMKSFNFFQTMKKKMYGYITPYLTNSNKWKSYILKDEVYKTQLV